MKRVAIYLRVSTSKQDTDNQRRELQAVAERSGWTVVKVYEDAGISGAKGRDQAIYRLADKSAGRVYYFDMSPVIPFRRHPIALGAIAAAVLAFAGTTIVLNWQSRPEVENRIAPPACQAVTGGPGI